MRLLLSPVLFTAIAVQWHRTACSLFIIISLSDVLDGWWARKFNQVTAVGRVLDPLLDKVVVCGAMILLASSRGEIASAIVSWMAVV
ncbi:MAG: CDP-alcohol phosphatidyltransferase family protein, partial [Pirellulales bacterium]|nr:CDP-alcohol phosphatidyltransferase family protein [Pirellulales bacterium]